VDQFNAAVAQLVEHVTENHGVVGADPTGCTNFMHPYFSGRISQ
jgi:hypothetical protein